MKKIKLLLLLVMTIVTQGVWGQEGQCTSHELTHWESSYDCLNGGYLEYWSCSNCGRIYADEACTQEIEGVYKKATGSHNFDFSDTNADEWHCQNQYCNQVIYGKIGLGEKVVSTPGFVNTLAGVLYKGSYNYQFYLYVPECSGQVRVINSSASPKAHAIAIFDKDLKYKNAVANSSDGIAPMLTCPVEKGEVYFIGFRAYKTNVPLENESFTLSFFCGHESTTHFDGIEATCDTEGREEYYVCNDCNTYLDKYGKAVNGEFDPIIPRKMHQLSDGVCLLCNKEIPTYKLNEEGIGEYEIPLNYNFSNGLNKSYSTIFRVDMPEGHGVLSVDGSYIDQDESDIHFSIIPASDIEVGGSNESNNDGDGKKVASRVATRESITESSPILGTVYVLVRHDNQATAKLSLSFEGHNIETVQGHVDPTCAPGYKAVYHCTDGCSGGYFYFTEDGVVDPNEGDVIIPATDDHNLNDKGVCTVCGQKPVLDDGENTVKFFKGNGIVTAFKYVATDTKSLNVTVETNATIDDMGIMPWSQWERENAGEEPKSAPRRANAKNTLTMSKKVVEGEEYAILFATSAENDEDATITLTYTEIVYPEVEVGENIIDIAAVDGDRDENKEHYNIFKFVAPKSGEARFYTQGSSDTYGMLFDSNFKVLISDDDGGEGANFKFVNKVVKGNIYYVGVRSYSGGGIGTYPLVIEYESIPEYEGTLVLDDTKSLEDNLGEWKDIKMFTATRGVTYNRNATTSKWGTVVLPYELQSNDKIAYYELTKADIQGGNLEFTKVETVAPNTPTVYRIINGNQYDASVEDPVTIEVPEKFGNFDLYVETKVESWFLDGWYYEDVIDTQHDDYFMDSEGHLDPNAAGIMYISKDQFWHATGSIKVKPYRAIFEAYDVNWSAPSVKAMTITFDDENGEATTIHSIMDEEGDFTDIETIYDLNGRKQSKLGQGVNIIRTADGKTRKIIQK